MVPSTVTRSTKLPSEVERIAEWLRSTVASVTGEFSGVVR